VLSVKNEFRKKGQTNVFEDSRYRRSICSNDSPFSSGIKKYLSNIHQKSKKNQLWNGIIYLTTYMKMKHPTQVPPQMKNTLTPRFAALTTLIPVLVGSTR
jgi:hypothetical protein